LDPDIHLIFWMITILWALSVLESKGNLIRLMPKNTCDTPKERMLKVPILDV
jgi:hypothetical protein